MSMTGPVCSGAVAAVHARSAVTETEHLRPAARGALGENARKTGDPAPDCPWHGLWVAEGMTWTRRIGALLILAGLGAAPVLGWRSVAADCEPPAPRVTTARTDAANDRTGFGVELEVLHFRIELAWFESVPVRPARRLVFSLLADPSRGE
jgi:hypothetical protein